jgi:hypothetical protein
MLQRRETELLDSGATIANTDLKKKRDGVLALVRKIYLTEWISTAGGVEAVRSERERAVSAGTENADGLVRVSLYKSNCSYVGPNRHLGTWNKDT